MKPSINSICLIAILAGVLTSCSTANQHQRPAFEKGNLAVEDYAFCQAKGEQSAKKLKGMYIVQYSAKRDATIESCLRILRTAKKKSGISESRDVAKAP